MSENQELERTNHTIIFIIKEGLTRSWRNDFDLFLLSLYIISNLTNFLSLNMIETKLKSLICENLVNHY